jgi:hypothetical protein
VHSSPVSEAASAKKSVKPYHRIEKEKERERERERERKREREIER